LSTSFNWAAGGPTKVHHILMCTFVSFVVDEVQMLEPERDTKENGDGTVPLRASEINIAPLDIGPDQLHTQPVSHIEPLLSLGKQSFDAGLQHANKGSLRSNAGDERVE